MTHAQNVIAMCEASPLTRKQWKAIREQDRARAVLATDHMQQITAMWDAIAARETERAASIQEGLRAMREAAEDYGRIFRDHQL
jgi:hypothetical protein